ACCAAARWRGRYVTTRRPRPPDLRMPRGGEHREQHIALDLAGCAFAYPHEGDADQVSRPPVSRLRGVSPRPRPRAPRRRLSRTSLRTRARRPPVSTATTAA